MGTALIRGFENNKAAKLDLTKITRTAADAKNGTNYVELSESKWQALDLSYKDRGDGSYMVYNNGQIIGFVGEDGIIKDADELETPVPVEEIPVEPAPVEQTPIEPAPVEPAPEEPAPEVPDITMENIVEQPTGNISGSISPGTASETFQAQSYNLTPEEHDYLVALVYSEASENPAWLESDTMAVTSVILNRMEHGGYGGSTVMQVGNAKNQFSGIHAPKFSSAMSNQSVVKPEMIEAIDRVLAGERNTNAYYFSGNGTYNSFR